MQPGKFWTVSGDYVIMKKGFSPTRFTHYKDGKRHDCLFSFSLSLFFFPSLFLVLCSVYFTSSGFSFHLVGKNLLGKQKKKEN